MAYMNISGNYTNPYSAYLTPYSRSVGNPLELQSGFSAAVANDKEDAKKDKRIGLKDPNQECETCENRKYQDGSNENNVSFKAASHVAPEAAASAVRAHENQHVANAYKKAASDNGKVIRANVAIHTAICPECGRSYVSGGTTSTQIKYYNEENPYQQDLKAVDGTKYRGMNVDLTA